MSTWDTFPVIADLTYVVGDPAVTITYTPFSCSSPAACCLSVTHTLSQQGTSSLPPLFALSASLNQLIVMSTSLSEQGTYTMVLTGTANGENTVSVAFNVIVLPPVISVGQNLPPFFETDLPSVIEVHCNEYKEVTLPQIKDGEGDHVTAALTINSKVPNLVYLKVDYSSLVFEPVCVANTSQAANIRLTDDNSLGA